mmetsp:Transcript_25257/g.44891  ORF Transcript_25257/g.44891 Transcript_25257/m.44891 type:complete len:1240 (-) Transcript_25257:53-3772(-)
MVMAQKAEEVGPTVNDPGLSLLGSDWTVKTTNEKIEVSSKFYVGPGGKQYSSLREAWKAADGKLDGEEFLLSGHPWIGQRVTRIFDGKPSDGIIKSWLPPSGGDEALWHVVHDDGDSEDLEGNEVEEAIEEFSLRPNKRVEASFQGKWYPGVLRKVVRSKLEPYGVKCDSDKNNSMLLWVPRRNVKLPPTPDTLSASLHMGRQLNQALLEHKTIDDEAVDSGANKGENAAANTHTTNAEKGSGSANSQNCKQAHAGRRRSKKSEAEVPSLISWNDYQRMHKGRQVTTEEWRKYVRSKLELSRAAKYQSPRPRSTSNKPEAASSSTPQAQQEQAQTQQQQQQQQPPNDGKRVRKKKINPDFLWGDDLRNPKRALVTRLEQNATEFEGLPPEAVPDRNDEECTICETGGDLLCCDGPCLRAFHLHCLNLKESDLPEKEWYCGDCAVGRPPRKYPKKVDKEKEKAAASKEKVSKGRPRPPPIDIPKMGSKEGKQGKRGRKPQSARRPQSAKRAKSKGDTSSTKIVRRKTVTSLQIPKAVSDDVGPGQQLMLASFNGASTSSSMTPNTFSMLQKSSSSSSRRNAGVPSRFKDSYMTLHTPQGYRRNSRKRESQSEPNKGNKKRSKNSGSESVEETKARLEERLRALETYLNKKEKTTSPRPSGAGTASSSFPTVPATPAPSPVTPMTPGGLLASTPLSSAIAATPSSTKSAPAFKPSLNLTTSLDGLEPWRRCVQCQTGRRSMTCAKQMCAVCCRSSGACLTHCRFFPGDALKIFKGPLQGYQGEMVAKLGRTISIRTSQVASGVLYVDETTLCMVQKGPKHAELASSSELKSKRAATSKQCDRCSKRFRNRNALASHQRSCRPIAAGVGVITSYGNGTVVKISEEKMAEVKLSFGIAHIGVKRCRLLPRIRPAAPKKRRKTLPSPAIALNLVQKPRMKRQKSVPLRFKKAQLSRKMALCFDLLLVVKRHKYGTIFSEPVPTTVAGYHDVIKEPMDLGTVENRMFTDIKGYDVKAFERDMQLIWANAMKFNPAAHPVHEMAATLKAIFDERIEKIKQRIIQMMKIVNKQLNKANSKQSKESSKKKKGLPKSPTSATPTSLDQEVRKLAQKMEAMRKKLQSMSSKGGGGGGSNRNRNRSGSKSKKPAKPEAPVVPPISYTERQQLKELIIQLPPDDLTGVAEIVRDSMPEDADSTEIEIDLEALDASTLRKLQKYVGECMLRNEGSMSQRQDQSSSEEEDSESD